ncbi:hypothetical protein V865_007184 [Kwoniella europaea PYCC6329]|uniref:BTB domain-containing protein n=1 Tax=Kwoniella europaea PYCC6329 TaxID=1423913 RepID=A0AAX4KS89_9TREE
MSDMSVISSAASSDGIAVDIDCKFHPVHNDPNDDIVIISNDYVKFRASRFHLARTSQFFEGLLGTARPKGENFTDDDEPIHLDYPSSTLSLFLDLTSVCDPYIPAVSIDRARSLLKFIEFAICDGLVDKARLTLMEAAKDQPFELLVIASERDDVEMAKHALRQISTGQFRAQFVNTSSTTLTSHDLAMVKQYLCGLTPPYHLAILDAAMSTGKMREERYINLRPGLLFNDNWSSFADKLDPAKFSKG